MEVVDTAQINSFAPIAAQTDFVPLSDLKATIANLQEISQPWKPHKSRTTTEYAWTLHMIAREL
jgi:hypothetical protein